MNTGRHQLSKYKYGFVNQDFVRRTNTTPLALNVLSGLGKYIFSFLSVNFSGSLEEILSEYTMEIFVKQIDRATEEPHHKRPRRGSSES